MNTATSNRSGNAIKMMVTQALMIALTLVATAFINIRLPLMGSGGLIHLGNVPVFLAAIIFGRKTGAIAGAFGMGLFDLLSGWAAWAPFTFVIVGAMGYVVGMTREKLKMKPFFADALGILFALILKITGYYFAEVILYHNWVLPFGSIPGNVAQIVVAAVIVLPIAEDLKKIVHKIGG